MKYLRYIPMILLLCLLHHYSLHPQQRALEPIPVREQLLLDTGWKFHFGHAANPKKDFDYGLGAPFAKAGQPVGAIHANFNDGNWRTVDLPHDWAVELEFVNVPDEDVKNHGYKPIGRQFPETTIGWYRRALLIPKTDEGKRISLRFDGVFRDCIVWLNGHYLGNNLSGYSEFSYDITDYINYGGKNTLVVRVDASNVEGWFYEGAGIYRHVWLIKHDPLHIPEYGVFVHSIVGRTSAEVTVETDVVHRVDEKVAFNLHTTILDPGGKAVSTGVEKGITLDRWQTKKKVQRIAVQRPQLWSLETPVCYTLVSVLKVNGIVRDRVTTQFGIRTILFDKDKGFFLNGKRVQINGVCCHQDHAGVGAALPDRLQYYRIERLKEMGCNAYRSSHNPPTRELLDACDRLGMLVMDETRLMGSSPEFTMQLERLILRDRNHPSIILWSIGNEEYVIQNTGVGRRIAESMVRLQKSLDPTRLSTYGGNNGNSYEGINQVVPVRGFNYMVIADIDNYRKEHPDQILIGSEEASTLCTRGIYANDTLRGYVCDYDKNKPGWGSLAEPWWKFFIARPWLAGAFVWTGFDYRGEPTPYSWPCISSHFGIMDVCGFPKNNYFYYQSWWSSKDVLHLAPHWNWKGQEGKPIEVWCQSNCESVELLLNGKSLGKKTMERNSHLEWQVPYIPGVLEARGSRNGKLLIQKVETTGEPVIILLTPDRSSIQADGEDVSLITVTALDAQGREVPDASNLIRFELTGEGKILGVGNGDPSSHERDRYLDGKYRRSLFSGKCQIIVQASRKAGMIELKASSTGLQSATLRLQTEQAQAHPFVPPYTVISIDHKAKGKKVEYRGVYKSQYSGGGPGGIVDGIQGTLDFLDNFWQGYEQNDLDIVIDLGSSTVITELSSTYLQNIDSWIFMPKSVEYEISEDGKTFKTVATIKNDVPIDKPSAFIKNYSAKVDQVTARFVRVKSVNVGLCPPWHKGAGSKAWLFADEVVVR